ncbi:MAG: YceI family protein [Anaerolineae bacterium]|nr:YceI family protein [Anaerolineae bacterium]
MRDLRLIFIAILSLAAGIVLGILGHIWFAGGPGAPSTAISAPTLDLNLLPTYNPTQSFGLATQVNALNQQNVALQGTVDALSAANDALATVAAQPIIVPTELPTNAPAVVPTVGFTSVAALEPTATLTPVPVERSLYRIVPQQSQVTFTLQETRNGTLADVVGTTGEVAGDIIVDPGNSANSQVGTIRINARTLATGEELRDRAIRAQILLSEEDLYEFVEFVPSELRNLPPTITIGQPYTFELVGNLTLIDTTSEVTFSVEAMLASEDQLIGSATSTIRYFDWGITIPSVPEIASISPDVQLTINFIANRVQN